MSQATKNFKGYAVGGDDTEWRKYIGDRFLEIMTDTKLNTITDPVNDIDEADEDNQSFINALSSFVDATQNVIGDTTISYNTKNYMPRDHIPKPIRGLL